MICECFSYDKVGQLAIIHGTFKSEEYVNICIENLNKAVWGLKLPDDYDF